GAGAPIGTCAATPVRLSATLPRALSSVRHTMRKTMHAKGLLPLTLALLASLTPFAAQARRALTPEDWYRFQAVSDLEVAPDGAAVAYLVTSYDKSSDESRSALWTADWAGTRSEQLTQGESVSAPR